MQITLIEQKEPSITFDYLYSKFDADSDQLIAVAQFKSGKWIGEVCERKETAQYRSLERAKLVEKIEENHNLKLKFESSKEDWYKGIPLPGEIFEVEGICGTMEVLGKTPGEEKWEIKWILPGELPEIKWFQWTKEQFEENHIIPA